MAKISVIGICGNSIFMNVEHFHEKGETLSADSVYEEIGGKGINQAIACARMGAEVSFLAAVGDDTSAKSCMVVAEENQLKGCFREKQGEKTTFAFILTDKSGENQVTVYKGAQLSCEDVLAFEQEIATSDILLLQQEVPNEVNLLAAKIADKYHVKVILNPAPIRPISDELVSMLYMVTPNEHEQQAIESSRFQNIITTLGEKGCMINETMTIPSMKSLAVDTTGAGDTFNGVLAVCIAEGMNLTAACKYAVVASGISVSRRHVLDAIPYRREIERRLREYE